MIKPSQFAMACLLVAMAMGAAKISAAEFKRPNVPSSQDHWVLVLEQSKQN
jgi:hypothetical protein